MKRRSGSKDSTTARYTSVWCVEKRSDSKIAQQQVWSRIQKSKVRRVRERGGGGGGGGAILTRVNNRCIDR